MNLTLPLVFAIAGVILLFIGITGGEINILDKVKVPKISIRMRILSLVFGIVLVIVGIWLTKIDPLPPNIKIEIKVSIIIPHEGDRVPREINVQGVYRNLPRDGRLWLYVFAPGIQRYFFHPIVTSSNGNWVATRVIIGSIDDAGQAFRIGVVTASPEASRVIEMNPNNVNNLPDGTRELHNITIFRK